VVESGNWERGLMMEHSRKTHGVADRPGNGITLQFISLAVGVEAEGRKGQTRAEGYQTDLLGFGGTMGGRPPQQNSLEVCSGRGSRVVTGDRGLLLV